MKSDLFYRVQAHKELSSFLRTIRERSARKLGVEETYDLFIARARKCQNLHVARLFAARAVFDAVHASKILWTFAPDQIHNLFWAADYALRQEYRAACEDAAWQYTGRSFWHRKQHYFRIEYRLDVV